MDISDKKQLTTHLTAEARELLQSFINDYEDTNDVKLDNMRAVFEALLETATSKFRPYKDNSKQIEKLQDQVEKHQAECQEAIKNYEYKIEDLKVKLSEKQDDTIISVADLKPGILILLRDYLTDGKTQKVFKKANLNGKLNGVIDVITGDILENEKIKRLLLNTFILSATGKRLPYLYSNKVIFETLIEKK